jgi:hypothetical protein
MSGDNNDEDSKLPQGVPGGIAIRAILNAASGAIPFGGGVLAAASAAWSEREQGKVNKALEHWLQMLEMELAEKAQTILEIIARLNLTDEKISERVASTEYQSLLRKAFREWPGGESEKKRELVRNILAHAADANLASDDVVRLFIQWLNLGAGIDKGCDLVVSSGFGGLNFPVGKWLARATAKSLA